MYSKQEEGKKRLTKKGRLAKELSIMKRLHNISIRFVSDDYSQDFLSEIVETAVIITDANMGNIQLYDKKTDSLKIIANKNFKQPFLDFFATVQLGQAACGVAMGKRQRVIISDVTQSYIFKGKPSLEVMLAAGVRAVQSTPLLSRSGHLMGMLSTHYHTSCRLDERDLQLLDLLARQSADIIERMQTEKALRQSDERFSKAFNLNPNMMLILSLDGTLIEVNKKFTEAVGHSRHEVIGKTIKDLDVCIDGEKRRTIRAQFKLEGRLHNYEIQYFTKSKELRSAILSADLISLENMPCYLIVMTDTTKQKQIEAEMARFDRLNLVGEMAASIGHEVRNPLTTVRGYLQIFQRNKKYADHRDQISIMIEELDRANSIITEFLSLAKNKRVELTTSQLNSIIHALFPLLQAEAFRLGHEIQIDIGDIPLIYLDVKEIRQLILNLVLNGLEAMDSSGILTIKTYIDSERVILAVQDTGKGISKEVLNMLGTPFFTTKQNGTGLGLAVCYRVVERHKATIKIDSSAKGTTFFIEFPIIRFVF